MSFPFKSWPHLADVVDRFEKEFGCNSHVRTITRLDGKSARLTIIERNADGVSREAVIEGSPDKTMGPGQIESICHRLGVAVSRFDPEIIETGLH